MMFETPEDRSYLVELEEGVLRLTFNRPDFGNAMPPTSTPLLAQLFEDAQSSGKVRCIHVRGEGKIFAAGGDVASFGKTLDLPVAERQADFAKRLGNLRRLVQALTAFEGPVVAAVRGAAAGAGLAYPLAADYVIADPTAMFVFAHQGIGLSPDGGVTALLPQAVGHRAARGLLLTAARVKSDEALRLGLINRIVAPEELETEAAALAKRLARAPQRAVKLAKALVNTASTRTLTEQLGAELDGIVECVGDDDFAEGVRAFLEKRPANFPSTR
jgi:2-(1,2-epoxy-1,2-dihydrophenyl)acetyl-CoA isomerase